jgi:hypothetical protein
MTAMSPHPDHLAHARSVADAVLYEGYLLYPYRGSAQKNQSRFQFGVLVPPAYCAVDPCEESAFQAECLVECSDEAQVQVTVRFLHLQRRTVQEATAGSGGLRDVDVLRVDGAEYLPWDEAAEREQSVAAGVASLLGGEKTLGFEIAAGEAGQDVAGASGALAGRLVRRWNALDGQVRVRAERVPGPYGVLRLRVRAENRTTPERPPRTRNEALSHSLIAAHALIGVPGGRFLSLTDPPEWAAAEAAACSNTGTWPVLAGPADCRDLMLSSPVILYDHPEIAAESAGDLFDATEIDEILTLRTLALTDAEKREARATDPRAAELIDRLDGMPPEMLERLHGAIRSLESPAGGPAVGGAVAGGPGGGGAVAGGPGAGAVVAGGPGGGGAVAGGPGAGAVFPAAAGVPWWDPGSDASVSPETDQVIVGGVRIARGSRVIMRPGTAGGARRADAQDLFLAGRTALVEAVLTDVDGQVHVAVSPDDDPAADLWQIHGRFLYFAPEELEPIEPAQRRKS